MLNKPAHPLEHGLTAKVEKVVWA